MSYEFISNIKVIGSHSHHTIKSTVVYVISGNRKKRYTYNTVGCLKKLQEYGLKNLRQRTGPLQPQHFNTIDIPKAMLTAPFLQYSALTPGQKRYLCSVCEAYSEAHMRKLMQQHYLNVLHRSIRTGNFITNTQLRTSPLDLDHSSTQQNERSDGKAKGQKDQSRSKEMTVFPKINRQQKSFPSRSPESILKKIRAKTEKGKSWLNIKEKTSRKAIKA